jgi:hypothetical protein
MSAGNGFYVNQCSENIDKVRWNHERQGLKKVFITEKNEQRCITQNQKLYLNRFF